MSALAASAPNPLLVVGRGVWIETLRRKDFYVLLVLMGFYACGALVVSVLGVENESVGRMLLELGLAFAHICAHLLALLTAGRQIPDEIETRSIHPLLAKPLRRRDYVLGKWIASATASCAAFAAFLAMVGLTRLALPGDIGLDSAMLAQTIALHCVSIWALSAIAILGSLAMPKAVNLVATGLLFFAGGRAANLASARAGDGPWAPVLRWIAEYIPRFDKLDTATRFADGVGPLGAGEFLGLAIYGAIVALAAVAAATALMNRKPL